VHSSLQHVSDKLKDQGYVACPNRVGRLLKDLKYSLKANVTRRAGSQHPDRNTQFEYSREEKLVRLINQKRQRFISATFVSKLIAKFLIEKSPKLAKFLPPTFFYEVYPRKSGFYHATLVIVL